MTRKKEREAETEGRKERVARTDVGVGAEVARGIGVGKESGIGITVMREIEIMVGRGIGTATVTGIITNYQFTRRVFERFFRHEFLLGFAFA